MKPSRSQFVDVRGLALPRAHVGPARRRKLFLLHGWMDVSASFQFLVDALAGEWHVLAPDWRGFGLSETPQDGYWFADYVADLDALVDALAPGEAVDRRRAQPRRQRRDALGRRAAGARAHVVSLDGFGMPGESAGRARRRRSRSGSTRCATRRTFAPYRDLAAVADRLQKTNPRLSRDKAEFLAPHWAEDAARRHGAAARRSEAQAAVPDDVRAWRTSTRSGATSRRPCCGSPPRDSQHPAVARAAAAMPTREIARRLRAHSERPARNRRRRGAHAASRSAGGGRAAASKRFSLAAR